MDKRSFVNGLDEMQLDILEACPKADLHNHTSRGGNIRDYMKHFGLEHIDKPSRFSSFADMEAWYKNSIHMRFTNELYGQRIKWAFQQIKRDGITLAILTFGISEVKLFGSPHGFIDFINSLKNEIIPDVNVIPELGIPSNCDIEMTARFCKEVFECNYFKSVDISGIEIIEPLDFLRIYKLADAYSMRKRAHVGEFGEPDIIRRAIEVLDLDEINHGINAVYNLGLINLIKKRNIRLNLCPASNIQLGLFESYKTHPMRKLFDYGVDITFNTDDMLIFNVSLSELYLDLYRLNIFSGEELNLIRENSLEIR